MPSKHENPNTDITRGGKRKKENCWEFRLCGRELGGKNAYEFGVCPASTETALDGVHRGENAGRACWVVAGTMCSGEVQGTFAQKYKNCGTCEFYLKVREEEAGDFRSTMDLLKEVEESEE